jgi:hypothetical protein
MLTRFQTGQVGGEEFMDIVIASYFVKLTTSD